MQSFIELNGMEFFAYHGVMEQERKTGNTFTIDIQLETDIHQAVDSDNIENTINYADLYELIKKEMEIPSNLLEHVAGRILKAIKQKFPQNQKISIRVAKKNPPLEGWVKEAAVTLIS